MSYNYGATLVRVVDGDTVELEVDLGFHLKFRHLFRLAGLNAPERDAASTEALRSKLLALGATFSVTTHKADKYGRWLVTIGTVNAELVAEGFAVPYMVGKL